MLLVELFLLDEVYLDVIDSLMLVGSGICIVEDICCCVCEEIGIIVLVGVVFNKFIVKIVSDWNKFDGLFVVWLE